jgi:hypothetical protein
LLIADQLEFVDEGFARANPDRLAKWPGDACHLTERDSLVRTIGPQQLAVGFVCHSAFPVEIDGLVPVVRVRRLHIHRVAHSRQLELVFDPVGLNGWSGFLLWGIFGHGFTPTTEETDEGDQEKALIH